MHHKIPDGTQGLAVQSDVDLIVYEVHLHAP